MALVKALCVVLLLHWANFGDSRSLKNKTISEKGTANIALVPHPHEVQVRQKTSDLTQPVREMEIEKPPPPKRLNAEDYRGFLLYLLREVWIPGDLCKGPYDVFQAANNGQLDVEGMNGLYFIFWSADQRTKQLRYQGKIYPLYIGITGRTFAQRFKEHIKDADGVVHKINQWPAENKIQPQILIVYVVVLPLPVAKFFESVFLSAFDFPMNKQENYQIRQKFTVTKSESVENGYKHFLDHYDVVKLSLAKAQNLVSQSEIEKYKLKEKYYNFKGFQ